MVSQPALCGEPQAKGRIMSKQIPEVEITIVRKGKLQFKYRIDEFGVAWLEDGCIITVGFSDKLELYRAAPDLLEAARACRTTLQSLLRNKDFMGSGSPRYAIAKQEEFLGIAIAKAEKEEAP